MRVCSGKSAAHVGAGVLLSRAQFQQQFSRKRSLDGDGFFDPSAFADVDVVLVDESHNFRRSQCEPFSPVWSAC